MTMDVRMVLAEPSAAGPADDPMEFCAEYWRVSQHLMLLFQEGHPVISPHIPNG